MHPTELANLLRDPKHVADAVIQLRALLPFCDVGYLASLAPYLLQPKVMAALPDVSDSTTHAVGLFQICYVTLLI